MSYNEGMTPADVAAVTGNGMFNGGGMDWIVLLFVIAMFGWGGNGGYGGGAAQNYVLSSDFATIQRQLSDGFNGIDNALDRQNAGICDLGYTELSLINGVNMNIKDCCCTTEKQFMQTRYDMAQQNCQTLQAIDKVGDRIIGYLTEEKTQALRDEVQALKFAASQSMQNEYLINKLSPCPVPSYSVPAPYPYNQGCGCNCNF